MRIKTFARNFKCLQKVLYGIYLHPIVHAETDVKILAKQVTLTANGYLTITTILSCADELII